MLQGDPDAVNRAFSKQSIHFDEDDRGNIILQDLRKQVYHHVDSFLAPASRILELNAGTGIDAERFVKAGHAVHATDLSDGMIVQLEKKKRQPGMGRLTVQQVSFECLENVKQNNYDLVFSNFGGLNCTSDLTTVGKKLPKVLKPGGFVTWVIMPVVSLWEVASIMKASPHAFRRWNRDGILANIDGEKFPTWYHTLSSIRNSLPGFDLIKAEGVASLSPPPYHAQFPIRHPRMYRVLRQLDTSVGKYFPFNRWADHIIVTLQLRSA